MDRAMQLRYKNFRAWRSKKIFDTKGGKHQKKDSESLSFEESLAMICYDMGGGGVSWLESINQRGVGGDGAMQLRNGCGYGAELPPYILTCLTTHREESSR